MCISKLKTPPPHIGEMQSVALYHHGISIAFRITLVHTGVNCASR